MQTLSYVTSKFGRSDLVLRDKNLPEGVTSKMKDSQFNPHTVFSCKNSLHTPRESYWAGLAAECLKRNCLHGPQCPQLRINSHRGRNPKCTLLKGHHTLVSGDGSRFKCGHKHSAPLDSEIFTYMAGFAWPESLQVKAPTTHNPSWNT